MHGLAHTLTYASPLIVVVAIFLAQRSPKARFALAIAASVFLIAFGLWFTDIELVRWTTIATGAMLLLAVTAGRGMFAPVEGPDEPLVPSRDRPLRHFGEAS